MCVDVFIDEVVRVRVGVGVDVVMRDVEQKLGGVVWCFEQSRKW